MKTNANSKMVIVSVLVLLVLCGSAWAFSGSGSGTEADPYVITDVYQLQEMQNDLAASYVLGNDIDASGTVSWNSSAGFEPVGNDIDYFTGSFDGLGHTITGLYINKPLARGVGLFGYLRNGAEVKNVGLIDAEAYGKYYVGTLAGNSYYGSLIHNCYAMGEVTISADGSNDAKSGGLVGSQGYSTISKCYSTVNVTALSSRYQIGGLCGYSRARSGDPPALIENCYSTGTVTSNGWKVGGLLGDADGENSTVSKCYSVGLVNGSHKKGLVGYNFRNPNIRDSYWDVQTSGCSSSYGGTGKQTAQMMQQATFVNWDFEQIWDIVENETYPFLRPRSPRAAAVREILDAIAGKSELLLDIEAALEHEQAAYYALEELLESGDYGNLWKGDIIKAQQKIHSAIQHERQSKNALEKSIEKLYESLEDLGWEPPPMPEPIAHWTFDEGSGTIAEDSAGSNDGTLINGPVWTTGQIDGALYFSGGDDYIDCGNSFASITGSTTKTITAWAKSDVSDRSGRIITLYRRSDSYSAFVIYPRENDGVNPATWKGLYATPGNGHKLIDSAVSVTAGEWIHVALVQDGPHVHIYVNGELENSASDAAAPTISNPPNAVIGTYMWYGHGPSASFLGTIDDVRLYNRALSAEEIRQLYNLTNSDDRKWQ